MLLIINKTVWFVTKYIDLFIIVLDIYSLFINRIIV